MGQDAAHAAASGDPDDHPVLPDIHQDAGLADVFLVDAAPARNRGEALAHALGTGNVFPR